MMEPEFVLTADVDWASDYCIEKFVDHAARHGIVPTLFVTHRSAVLEALAALGRVDLGIHPNFLAGSTQGTSIEEVLEYVLDLVAHPVAMRSHCYFDNSHVAKALKEHDVDLDSNLCCHLQEDLPVLRHWNGILRLPVFFEDDVHWSQEGTWRFKRYQQAFASDGLKILNFHPFFWALNVPNAEFYEQHRAHIPTLDAAAACKIRFPGKGSATFLDEIIDWVGKSGRSFVRLKDLTALKKQK